MRISLNCKGKKTLNNPHKGKALKIPKKKERILLGGPPNLPEKFRALNKKIEPTRPKIYDSILFCHF